ncbi:hypothetical protein PAPYR_122 [Paratrimastix pyriformis]|uniref:N-acetyltransferase domain-containing protein n=1 Tax=Paratrimastix pyriformis TaxID=342808 RepID=A0ABQ8UVJ7_9EUKA|nr:hypothetical protein PAPYR_122 [Paratrimastix pyriformis]
MSELPHQSRCNSQKENGTAPPLFLRPACSDDVPFLIDCVLNAERGHIGVGWWDLAFPNHEDTIRGLVSEILLTSEPVVHRMDGFLVAVLPDGRPIAGLMGCDLCPPGVPRTSTSRNWEVQIEVFKNAVTKRLSADELPHVMAVLEDLYTAIPEDTGRCWVLDCLYVLPEYRGHGISEQLLRRSLARGAELGIPEARLITYSGNESSLHVYRRLGFETGAVTTHPAFAAAQRRLSSSALRVNPRGNPVRQKTQPGSRKRLAPQQ